MKKKKDSNIVKRKKNTIYTMLNMIFLLVFLFSAYKLYSIYKTYKDIDTNNAKIQSMVVKDPFSEERVDENDINTIPEVDFAELKKLNSDIIGYIYLPNSNINYPILQGETNDTYLKTNVSGNYSIAGSIFLDSRNTNDFTDSNSVIHGHHMKNGSMFANVSKFKNTDYAKEHTHIFIYLEDVIYKYHIFSFYTDEATSDVYNVSFKDDDAKLSFFNRIQKKSKLNIDVTLASEDKVITLSTCTNATGTGRYLLHAKLVETKIKEG